MARGKRSKGLRELDLNLLPVLRSLLDTTSVARTAKALAMSPSAVSHALARLRTVFGDELFARSPSGLVPTARAIALAKDLELGLATLERAIGARVLDLRTVEVTFRLATTDFGARMVLPRLLALLEAEAPGIQVHVRPLPLEPEDALASGDLDAMIGVYRGTQPALYRRALFSEGTAVLARRGHPAIKPRLDLDAYLAASHIMIAPRGQPGSRIDRLLAERGQTRRIASTVPEFLVAPFIVSETDLLLTAGERLLQSFVAHLPVQVVALPIDVPPFDVDLVWHARLHDDPTFAWFRDQLVAVHQQVYR